jgi:hypothetical protein
LFALTVGTGIALGDTRQIPAQADSVLGQRDDDDDDDDDGRRSTARVTSFRSDVTLGTTGTGQRLPLTGVTVSGRCTLVTPPPPFGSSFAIARALVEAASGTAMDALSTFSGTFGGQSLLTQPLADTNIGDRRFGTTSVIVSSGGATATITIGGAIDLDAGTCTFLGQAVEAPNS